MAIHEPDHASQKLTLPAIAEMAKRHDRLVMVTAYDAPSARLADACAARVR